MRVGPGDAAVPPDRRKWFRLGVAIAVLWAAFTAILLVLLRVDVVVGLVFAVVASTIGGVALMLFVTYVYR